MAEITREDREAAAVAISTGPKLHDHLVQWVAGGEPPGAVYVSVAKAIASAREAGRRKALAERTEAWVPVSERLPEKEDEVLIQTTSRWGTGRPVMHVSWWNGFSWEIDEGCLLGPDDVTHWRPLPRPPESETP